MTARLIRVAHGLDLSATLSGNLVGCVPEDETLIFLDMQDYMMVVR